MVMELIVGVIGVAFVTLVVFLIITLHRLRRTMKKADLALTDAHKILTTLSEPSFELLHHTDKLILDLKKKSEGLDILFRPLYAVKKEKSEPTDRCEKISEIIECVADGVRLFSKIRNEMK